MARKTSINLELTKQKIVEAGLNLFERQGFNATGIQQITAAASVPKGSFYNYFSSKEDFGVAIITYYTEKNCKEWQDLLAGGGKDPYLALHFTWEQLILQYEYAEPKKGCLLGNFAAEISEVSEECRLAMRQSVERFKEILVQQVRAAQRDGKVRKDLTTEEIADLLWNCWQGSLLRMKIEKSTIPLKNVMKVLNMILAE